jgi:hypothetical protein
MMLGMRGYATSFSLYLSLALLPRSSLCLHAQPRLFPSLFQTAEEQTQGPVVVQLPTVNKLPSVVDSIATLRRAYEALSAQVSVEPTPDPAVQQEEPGLLDTLWSWFD